MRSLYLHATAAATFVLLLALSPTPGFCDDFKTGVIVPLSGPVSAFGVAIQNGIALAKEEKPQAFARCRFEFEDSAYKTPQALSALQKLVHNGSKIIYVFGGPMGEALAPVAQSRSLPLITDSNDPRVSEGREFVLRYAVDRLDLGKPLVESLVKRGIKKARLVKAENQYINGLVEGVTEAAKGKLDIELVASVSPEDQDLRFLVPKLLATKSDAVGLFLFPGQVSSFARLLKGQLNGELIFGGDFLENSAEISNSQGVLEGALYPNSQVAETFAKTYLKRFGNSEEIKFAAEGYDVANLIANQICTQQAPLTGEQILKLIYSTPPVDGALTHTEFRRTATGDKYFFSPVRTMRASASGASPE